MSVSSLIYIISLDSNDSVERLADLKGSFNVHLCEEMEVLVFMLNTVCVLIVSFFFKFLSQMETNNKVK